MIRKKYVSRLAVSCYLVLLVAIQGRAETLFSTKFNKGGWNPEEWILAKSPELNHFGKWVQRDASIENETPADEAKKTSWAETFTTMVYKDKVGGDVTISSTMEFLDRYAPGIVLVQEIGSDKEGKPEYREFFEVCIYNEGVNIWQHFFKDGKWGHKKTAYENFTLKPNTHYRLEIKKKGKEFSVAIDGHKFGYLEVSLPEEVYAGIEGCEGVNRFYDFAIDK